ncbi:MAG: hypothetical protein M5U28_34435 [Sandaracinaceae bacterium]|nr:hypothetical protein [Sandaracinaceae bacterium]
MWRGELAPAPPRFRAAAFFALLATAALGCGAAMPRYPLRPIVWDDPDRRPFAPAPEERWVPYYWDATDNLFVRPVVELLAFEPPREAINVNALDEVPGSSWFTNRIGRTAMSPEEVAVGPCEGSSSTRRGRGRSPAASRPGRRPASSSRTGTASATSSRPIAPANPSSPRPPTPSWPPSSMRPATTCPATAWSSSILPSS